MTTKYWNNEPLKGKEKDLKMRGVIHVGSHIGQEYPEYVAEGLTNIVFIEPLKDNFEKLTSIWDFPQDGRVICLNMALGNVRGEVEMFVETANQGMSSSILEPGTHLDTHPKITFEGREMVKIDKLDNLTINRELYNVLNLDVQGYELEVLKGGEQTLEFVDVIFTEINTGEVYKGCAKLGELDEFLVRRGFFRYFTHEYPNIGYGDAIYVRRNIFAMATHQPVTLWAVRQTDKPILELGAGDCSTRQIHEATEEKCSLIVTIDDNPEWVTRYLDLNHGRHYVKFIQRDSLDTYYAEDTDMYGMVLVDLYLWESRMEAIISYNYQTEYMVIHDAERAILEGYVKDFSDYFKSWIEFASIEFPEFPTTVLGSNHIDLSGVEIEGMKIIKRNA